MNMLVNMLIKNLLSLEYQLLEYEVNIREELEVIVNMVKNSSIQPAINSSPYIRTTITDGTQLHNYFFMTKIY